MKRKVKIGLIAEGFIEWPGGIEFLKYILLGLNRNNYEITLLIPDRNNFSLKVRNKIKKGINAVFKNRFTLLNYPPVNETCNHLKKHLSIEKIIVYGGRNEITAIANKNFDIVLPAFYPPSKKIKIPVISYLYDFQYKYFPEFFLGEQVKKQDKHFKKHIEHSKEIIVNAYSVKSDIEKFYGRTDLVHVIPFTPIFDLENYLKIPDYEFLVEKYKIGDKPYFIVCNQFWRHKGHKTVFDALQIAIQKYNLNFNIVCTGRFPDPKNKGYCDDILNFIEDNGLTDNVKFVGFIDKVDQLGLILNSCALLQPTQFEGGPGGFSVYEALAYMHPCIISDIDVNKEILDNELLTFFNVNSADDLAVKMEHHLKIAKVNTDVEKLKDNFDIKKKLLISFWDNLINEILTGKA